MTLGEGLREIARRRAQRSGAAQAAATMRRGEPAAAPGVAAPYGTGRPGEGVADLDGAETIEVDGEAVLSVRRDVEALLPGGDVAGELTRALDALAAADPDGIDRGLAPARGMGLADLAILDLETTGFWGCPILLVGLLQREDGLLVTRQLVARDYPEERPVLVAALEHLAARRLLVTFNGKSYDVPCLRERCIVHRIAGPALARLAHVDVLHAARRRWRRRFGDCRLSTLERRVTGVLRSGDVESRDVPAMFHRFVATGDAALLRPVLHHGRMDLLTTARLFADLAARVCWDSEHPASNESVLSGKEP